MQQTVESHTQEVQEYAWIINVIATDGLMVYGARYKQHGVDLVSQNTVPR